MIKVRSNVDQIFYSFVGSGRSWVANLATFFLRIHTYLISVWKAISRAQAEVLIYKPKCVKKAPNNASSQTKNYEITFYSKVTEGSYHSSLF